MASSADVYTSAYFALQNACWGMLQAPLICIFQCRLRIPSGRFLPGDVLRVVKNLHEVRSGFCKRIVLHLFRNWRFQKRNAPRLHTVRKFFLCLQCCRLTHIRGGFCIQNVGCGVFSVAIFRQLHHDSKSGRSEPCRRYSPCHGTVLLRCSIVESRTKCNSVPKEPAVLPSIALHAGIHVLDYSANMGSTFHSGHLPLLLRYWVASSCRSPQILAISVMCTLIVLIIDYLRAKRKSVSTFAALLDIGVIL